MVPIHKLDENGNWVDINKKDNYISSKIAFDFDDKVDAFVDVWKLYPNAGFSDPDTSVAGDAAANIVGMFNDQDGYGWRPYRQFFLWEFVGALSGSGDIDISAMSYNFNNVFGNADYLQVTKVLTKPSNDPPTATHAQNLWNNATFEPFTSVEVDSDGVPTKYTVNLSDDISTLENRINTDPTEEEYYWYSVHHRKQTESGYDGWDICAANVGEEECGILSITYTRQGGGKIAVELPVMISPNPFNPVTILSFTLPEPSNVVLDIYSITGQKVVTLIDGYTGPGKTTVTFNGKDYSSGIYFYSLRTQNFLSTGKMLLVK